MYATFLRLLIFPIWLRHIREENASCPCLWLVIPIYQLIPNMYIGLPVALAVCLIPCFLIDRIYEKPGGRGHFVREYFKNTKYNKFGWKALAFVAWVILWFVIPLILLKLK